MGEDEVEDVEFDGLQEPKFEKEFFEKWKEVHEPDETEILFIAESPPKNGLNYFYYTGRHCQSNGLVGNLLSPLEKHILENKDEKKDRVRKFINHGYWLTDLFFEPIDYVSKDEIGDHNCKLKDEIQEIDPEKILFILPKGVFDKESSNSKYKKMKEYFQEVENREADQFISTQKEILSNLKESLGLDYDPHVAPFPSGSVANQWDVSSFSDWVHKNKNLLEIEEDE